MPRTALLLLLAALLASACASRQDGAPDQDAGDAASLPRTLAVLPAVYEPEGEPDVTALEDHFVPLVLGAARTSLFNFLAGKGYTMIPCSLVDEIIAVHAPGGDWRAAAVTDLARDLGADGLVRLTITTIQAADNLPHDAHLVSGRADLTTADGAVLGSWEEAASARDLPAAEDPGSAAALLFETAVDQPTMQLARTLSFRWGALVAGGVAPLPDAPDQPVLHGVEANVQQGIFGLGRLVAVRMTAQPGLEASFSLGDYRTDIPLEPLDLDEPGDYVGLYRVLPGDEAGNLPLIVRVEGDRAERVWIEECRVTLDGTVPEAPDDLKAEPTKSGVLLTWTPPSESDLAQFLVQRADKTGDEFVTVGASRQSGWLDESVFQEAVYRYRVLAQDEAGNRSPASGTVKVLTPRQNPTPLPSVTSGVLSPGPYLVPDVTVVPEGKTLRVPAGAELVFDPGSALLVDGRLVLAGRDDLPTVLSGRDWHGVVISPGGRLVASRARFEGCEFCLLAEEAEVALDRVALSGGSGTGVELINCQDFALEGIEVHDFRNGVVLTDSWGHLTEASIRKNSIGLTVTGGGTDVVRNDISGNGVDVASDRPLVLRENYLGSTDPAGLRIEGPVEVRSLLTDKPPYGQVVSLDLTGEERAARFEEYRNAGAAAFAEGRWDDAREALAKAVALVPDRDVLLLLAHTLQAQGDDPLPMLRQALDQYPGDARIHLALARELAAQGRTDEALEVVRQGLASQPGHKGLLELEAVLGGKRTGLRKTDTDAHAPAGILTEEQFLERELAEPEP